MTHASLFSGIGGAEVAASWMGWTNLFHCEINPFGRKVLDYWFPESESYEDITKTDFSKWNGQVDVLTGGFPCQPFSLAGKRAGANDDRYLWPQMLRAIHEIQPDWIVGENVSGILTMVEPSCKVKMGNTTDLFETNFIYKNEFKFTIERIFRDIEHEGYSVQAFVIPACAVGAPHRRDRVWIVASRDVCRTSSDTNCNGRRGGQDKQELLKRGQGEANDCFSSKKGNVTNTKGQGLAVCLPSKRYDKKGWGNKRRPTLKYSYNYGIKFQKDKWGKFPTQSPVCRRNDGLPFDVDDLTIPFTKWRQESIKAYGNAWVPQVAFEIFKAIEEVNKTE